MMTDHPPGTLKLQIQFVTPDGARCMNLIVTPELMDDDQLWEQYLIQQIRWLAGKDSMR